MSELFSDGWEVDRTAVLAAMARCRSMEDTAAQRLVDAIGAPDLSQFPDALIDRVVGGVAVRTCFLDAAIAEAHVSGIQQVVVLGSGLDTRPWRLHWHRDDTVWHVDRETTVSLAGAVLGSPDTVGLHLIVSDLDGEGWMTALENTGHDCTLPTLFLAEAVLLYLTPEVARDTVLRAERLSAPGSCLAFTYRGERYPSQNELSAAVRSAGASFRSAISSPQEFLRDTAWKVTRGETYEGFAARSGLSWVGDEDGGVSWLCQAHLPM